MPQIPDFIAQSYTALSPPLNASRCVNFFPEIEAQDSKSKTPVPVWGSPGIADFALAGAGPVKAFNVMNDVLYAVAGQRLYRINSDQTATDLGAWLLQDRVSIDNNGVQIVAVDGFTGWVYQPAGIYQPIAADGAAGDTSIWLYVTGTIESGAALNIQLANGAVFTTTTTAQSTAGTIHVPLADALPSAASTGDNAVAPSTTIAQITDPNFFPARTVTYFDGYFVFDRKGTKQFFISPLFGITPLDPGQFASKEATSDLLLAIANSHEQLYLFGERRIEVWFDAGNAPPTFPFQRSDGAIIQRGIVAPYSVVLEDNTLFFLGDDGMFYRLESFVPERLSNHAVEAAWQGYGDLSTAFALIYTLFGHKLLTLTFPTAPATWVLDLSTRRWHERESWIGSNADASIGRWRVECALNWQGRILAGDSQSGRIGQLSTDVYTEWGDTMRGLLVGPPIAQDRRRLFMRRFELDVESGVGMTPAVTESITEYCASPVQMTSPQSLASGGELAGVGAAFSTACFSEWVYLPDDRGKHGWWWSNQPSDATPGAGGMQIGVFNSTSSDSGYQIVVNAWDAANAAIVAARFAFLGFQTWVWIGISIDTTLSTLQVFVGNQQLTPTAITWSSRNPISNKAGASWHLLPAIGP